MGSSASTDRQTYHYPTTSLTGGGVGALVREIGMAIIPVHMKQSYESIMQIVGEQKQDYCDFLLHFPFNRNSNEAAPVR